jgi:hypothetical protein
VNREGRIINSPVDNVVVKGVPSTTALEAAALPASGIDPAVRATATEFNSRLTRNGGRVEALTFNDSSVSARWTSAKCDYFEPEVIDLLLSLNRTIKSSPSISGERTCQGRRRSFKISGALFQQYRTGKISDTRVLSGIK